ncbi:MAG: tyrosine--tRNA ligase [Actinomycetota bacterium]|nr:tyrosine--tRNA ligase [Actinomycetota bacterium]
MPQTGSDNAAAVAGLIRGAVDVLPAGRLREQLETDRPLRVKFGMDPTSADIHIGHCVVLSKLRAFQDLGHTVVLIVGDYTARVGDPSGRDGTRPVLSNDQIEANAKTYQEQAFKVLDRDRTEIRQNSEWLEMPSAELFELVRRFTVARLLERDDFQRRIEQDQAISALELLYPVLQGYDSVAVAADVELGATDQKFNLLFARDVQQAFGQTPQSILTMPILVGTDGVRKMSKSYDNYVGLTDAPGEMFGRLMSVPDHVMADYYLLLLGRELDRERHPNEAKRMLAHELVSRFHSELEATEAERRFDAVHKWGEIPADIPSVSLPDGEAAVHMPAFLARTFGVSASEGRRLLAQGGVKLDGQVVPAEPLDVPASALSGKVIQVGKRRFARIA